MPFRWLRRLLGKRYERDYGKKSKKANSKGRSSSQGDIPNAMTKTQEEEATSNLGPSASSVPSERNLGRFLQTEARAKLEISPPINNHDIPKEPEKRLFVVLYDYDARRENELNIRRNEIVEVLEETATGWWYVQNNESGGIGYIPANYIAEYNSMEAKEWYFSGMRRVELEHILLGSSNRDGSFLIRDSETRSNEYSLSVRFQNKVRNYKIHYSADYGYSINRTITFKSLQELVNFYKRESAGLCTLLTEPCVKVGNPETVGLSYDNFDQWEIPKTQIKLHRLLGSGNFGEVYEGSWNEVLKVAVKTLKPGKMRKDEFLDEAQFLKRLRHKNLLQLYGVCTKEEPLYIITELMQHGSLLSYLRDGPGQRAELEELIHIAAQVAGGMWYLETQNYIHRDLAARNVLIGENNQVKVADFGLSRLVPEDDIYQARDGGQFPIKWTAPEALTHNKFSIKSDVWAFGILLHEIISKGCRPYPGMSNLEVQERVEQGYRMRKHPSCPQLLYQIMLETWDVDPQRRPNFETLQWKLEDFFSLEHSEYKDADSVA